ncbi:MAG TPA: patatin-like phospholipase family protein [Bryobacteraceae bacterium]|nr:patatin-like phospholipase family protein [Bryobacteraceae bacterium]
MSTQAFTILSFCGGGIRGLASVTMLQELYANHKNVISGANMLAGTSTGAGIVAALAKGATPEELIYIFEKEETKFYEGGSSDPTQPAYSVSAFQQKVQGELGQQTLSGIKQNVLMTAFNVGDAAAGTGWYPQLFNNFPGSASAGMLVSDAVVASGAMPGMFGSYQGNVDGAFVHHDPTLVAIAMAVASGQQLSNIVAICFGTGFMQNSLGSATENWGAQQWQTGDPQNPYNVPPLLINGGPSPILNISLNGTSSTLMTQLCTMMLTNPGGASSRYASLNPPLDRFIPENDTNSQDLAYLVSQAKAVDTSAAVELINTYWPAQTSTAGRSRT